jgi:hypothetical protein
VGRCIAVEEQAKFDVLVLPIILIALNVNLASKFINFIAISSEYSIGLGFGVLA